VSVGSKARTILQGVKGFRVSKGLGKFELWMSQVKISRNNH
jgi:ribosomal protein L16/L10AE